MVYKDLERKAFEFGSSVLEQPINLRYIIYSILLALPIIIALQRLRISSSDIPIINAYPGDWSKKKAHAAFLQNAKGLIAEGSKKYDGPFRVITTLSSRVILPPSYTDWVKNCKDLDHQALVANEYLSAFPGFEGIKITTDSHLLSDVSRTKLSTNMKFIDIMQEHVAESLKEAWTDSQDWHSIDWAKDAVKFIGRMSASVFVGSELARDPEWQDLTITYAVNLFQAARALRATPEFLRPLAHWFLPECKKARAHVELTRVKLRNVLKERAHTRDIALAEGRTPEKFDDSITWLEDAAKGRKYDPVDGQLGLAAAALHTTTELLKQSLLDLARYPELMEPLREEVSSAIAESGWTTAGMFKMQLLDSMVKETQRLKPGALVNLERRALSDIVMPNGKILPRNTNIAVDTSEMWNPEVYENPDTFDAYRFLRMRQSGGKRAAAAQLVSTSQEHIAFGMGKPICPGRFFAANEVKIALAEMMLNYDVRLQEGINPMVMCYGFEMLSDPMAKVEVRRRQN